MGTLNGSSLINGITSGLTSTYSVIANSAGTSGVTLDSILAARSNSNLSTTLNQSFASYLQTNFSTLDKDKDGILSASELSNTTNMMNTTGMTQAQLTQLGLLSGLSTEALQEVLAHFSDIDTNGDGKVTTAEINAYNLTSAKEKKETEFRNKFASNMSVYYGEETSSTPDSSSLLSYRYLQN